MFSSKVLVLVSVVACISASPQNAEDLKNQLHANMEACQKEFNIQGVLKDIIKSDQEQPDNVKCFIDCFYKKDGLIKDDKVDKDRYVHILSVLLSPDAANKIAEACLKDAVVTSCDGASKFHICTMKKAKELAAGNLEDV